VALRLTFAPLYPTVFEAMLVRLLYARLPNTFSGSGSAGCRSAPEDLRVILLPSLVPGPCFFTKLPTETVWKIAGGVWMACFG
jgi:hypothetical protein